MANTKKKTTPKKEVPPPPPKNIRMDIVCDPERQAMLQKLADLTGQKTNTKALFHTAEFFLNLKPVLEKKIKDQDEELRIVRNELYLLKQNVHYFITGFSKMQEAIGSPNDDNSRLPEKTNTLPSSGNDKPNTSYSECPECEESLTLRDNDLGFCPNCDEQFKHGLSGFRCPHCGQFLDYDDITGEYCNNCDEPFDNSDLK